MKNKLPNLFNKLDSELLYFIKHTPAKQANKTIYLFFTTKILPMIISGGAIYLGYKLFILGVTGQASLSIETKTVSGQLLNAAPGLFFAGGGIISLIYSIYKGVEIDFNDDDKDS